MQQTSIWRNFILIVLKTQKKSAEVQLPLCANANYDVTDFEVIQISQKHKNIDISRKHFFFLQIEKLINYISRATLKQKNNFVAEVTFNIFCWKQTCSPLKNFLIGGA